MTPEEVAASIIDRFPWTTNMVHDGKLVGQQYLVAAAIVSALKAERERAAMICEQAAKSLICGRRSNAIDRHTAHVLMDKAERIRTGDH